jgi:methionyl-tRNA formyltransferase
MLHQIKKMRLIIFTNRDLSSNLNLNLLLPHIGQHVVHIFVSDKVGGNTPHSNPPEALKLLKFFEHELPINILFPAFEKQENREIKDGKLLTFNELSKKHAIPIETLNDVRSPESLKMIADLQPDLVLSVRYGKIFGKDFLKIPKLGTINLHSGKLPNYRGVLATFRALMNGDDTLHGTLHYIEDGTIDTGGIIGFSTVKVNPKWSLLTHILNIYPASMPLVVATIEQIFAGNQPATTPQTNENAAYFTFPIQAEVDEFTKKGWFFADKAEFYQFLRQYV